MMDYKVIAVTSRCEKQMYSAIDCEAACEMAATRNASPYTILYIVEKPNGERMSIRDQREFMGAA